MTQDEPTSTCGSPTDPGVSWNGSAPEPLASKRSTEEGAPAVDSGGNGR
jgi:hypothetical protein